MENKKYNYTIQWRQAYDTWPTKHRLDEAVDTVVEAALEHSLYTEARMIIERIKQWEFK
jgi:hypothetical protein